MISVLRNKHISNSGNVGKYLFRIGVFFLPSALTISILFLLVSSIINFLYQKKNFLNNWINKSFIAASLLMIFSAFVHLFNFNKGNSELLIMAKWEPTLSFVGLLNWIPLFWIFISLQAYVKDKEAREICAKCFILGVIPVIISGLGQSFFNWQDTSIFLNGLIIWYQKELINPPFELSGLFSNANYTGAWLNITFPFSIGYLIKNENISYKKFFIIILILSLVTSIILTNSRAAWGSLVGSLILMYWGKNSKIYFIIATIFFILIFLCLYPIFGESIQIFFRDLIPENIWVEFMSSNFSDRPLRINIWNESFELIKSNPFFGTGAATFEILTYENLKNEAIHSHNLPLELALQYGIPSMLIIVSNVFYLTCSSLRKIIISNSQSLKTFIYERAWVTSVLILVLIHLFDIQYYDGRISIASWILLAGMNQLIQEN
tara:strand:- start:8986 stop:10290 length:1305 start_codon:yes stop_codon:yes gene_type:complete